MKKVILPVGMTALMVWSLFLIPAPGMAADDEVRLGVISPASGNYADLGAAERRGITMAVEEINAGGGVMGKKVRMIVEDTETDPAAGARKAKKLIERDKVHFMAGAVSSSVAIAISEVAQRAYTIYFNTNTNSDECTGIHCHRTNFRVGPNNHMLVYGVAPFIAKNIGKKWYFITHDYSWGRSGTKVFREILKQQGGTELGEALIPMGTRDFSSYLIKIRNLDPKPDIIMCTIGGVDRSAMFEQIKEFGMDKDFKWGFSLMDYGDIYAVGPQNAVGDAFAIEWYHKVDAPGVKEFVDRYKQRWPDAGFPVPENNTYQGYLGVRTLLRAAMRAKSLETTPIIKALEGHTITDNMKKHPTFIRPWDHQFVQDVYIARIKSAEELKKDPNDFYDVFGVVAGEDVVRSRDENPCKLEPYQ
jgi:branched-chain amino acid transport system substrate-binding protein